MSSHPRKDYETFKKITGILKDTNTKEYSQDDFEYLSKVGLLSKTETDSINDHQDNFNISMEIELQNATRRLKSSIKSPYETDKEIGLDLDKGLSSVFPVNSRCVTFKMQGPNSVGYISVNQTGKMVEIFKRDGKIEEFTVSTLKKESMFSRVARNYECQEQEIETLIKNKKPHEYDEVFHMRTGYKSFPDFIETKMPDLVSQLTNKNEILNSIHTEGLNSVIKFNEGSITEENLINAAVVSKIYENLLNGNKYSDNERAAYFDQMSYIDFLGNITLIEGLNEINTKYLCNLSCYGVDRISTENKRVAVFKLEDGTAVVSIDGSISKYNPDELLEEYDSIYNTPELFTMLDMYYLGECKIETQPKPEPKPEPEPEVDIEPEVKKTRTIKPGR